ncbi:hypothetical protein [Breznakia pachnodae]|uniref:HEAT repeat domain-containing protein n=1 Tax=Breznakia pachnodae TaxID=265178 RepID=A0ABU0E5C6_9FIRM|nr:hypothetical protein [Breznakia pachnodae]MDQ0362010.1 hypothetical protein [Breznakia pachnodae]
MIERLATNLGRNDEEPNIELAEELVKNEDAEGIKEIVGGLTQKKAIANDSIKVLYEIGERNPKLIRDYADDFLNLLTSSNNRLVWGAMTALNTIAEEVPSAIFTQIDKVISAYKNGSVITIDNSMSVFAKVCMADKRYEVAIFPMLMEHLRTCRAKEIPQHAERISICINSDNKTEFLKVLEERKDELSISQLKRVQKLIKDLEK